MRKNLLIVMVVQTALVAGFGVALRSGVMPLGVPGEWEWSRLPRGVAPGALDVALGLLAVAAFAGLAGIGRRLLADRPSRVREAIAVATLWVASIAVQVLVTSTAPEGYGLSKWAFALHNPGSSGYYTVARSQVRDPRRFLREYPEWIRHQDALHIGTHPPGLFLVAHGLLAGMESHPETARWVGDHLPPSLDSSFRAIASYAPMPRADRAALALTGALTLLACASTVVPLYLLARASLPAASAWSAAALWPLVPSAVLFAPGADTAFPFLATLSLALAAHAGRRPTRGALLLAFEGGLLLAVGMFFTLAFLPVGLIAGIVLAGSPGLGARRRALLILATGCGFLAVTLAAWAVSGADPFVIWWWNQRNHARFYVEYPRSYRAWIAANPVELAVGLGLPVALWAVLGVVPPRNPPRVALATLGVLAILSLSGKNLSEVGRLWLPMMPAFLGAAGAGMERMNGGPTTLAWTVGLLGIQLLVLQATIQVVYPV